MILLSLIIITNIRGGYMNSTSEVTECGLRTSDGGPIWYRHEIGASFSQPKRETLNWYCRSCDKLDQLQPLDGVCQCLCV